MIEQQHRVARTTTFGRVLGAALLLSALFVTACNTVEGAGEDVQSVGHATSEASRDARR